MDFIINFSKPMTGNFIVDIIVWIVGLTSSIAAGIVLFTLLLKLITLPFDYVSRASMRKNSIKMEEMRPELEKLQKQYANDKVLYNQKMMALYKRNGYSMWGSCLPTILTLVIFIIAINAFSDFSRIQNQKTFYNMSLSYNSVVYEGLEADGEIFTYDENEKIFIVNTDKITEYISTNTTPQGVTIEKVEDTDFYQVKTNGYIIYQCKIAKVGENYVFDGEAKYLIDEAKVKTSDYADEFNALKVANPEKTDSEIAKQTLLNEARERSATSFTENNVGFFWVKNIWMPDSSFEHPIYSQFDKFVAQFGYDKTVGSFNANDYNELIANLGEQKTQSNGYFILVVLTAGITLLSQMVMTKSQKAQMELQTVDGQGMQTQKTMKWMMPMMMGFFAFMYTAAFSIYIVVSSALGMGITVAINYFVDKKYKNVESLKSDNKVRGRVYNPKPEVKEEKKPTTKKKKVVENDFLSGLADKTKSRKK